MTRLRTRADATPDTATERAGERAVAIEPAVTGVLDLGTGWAGTELRPAAPSGPDAPADGVPGAAAFFDLDNTMLRGASVYYLARGLAARDFFSGRDLARFAWDQVKFRVVGAEDPDDIAQARHAALAFVKGWRVGDLAGLCEEIFDELMAEKIWAGTRALAQRHLDAGERVWLVTAAPVELGSIVASRLGLTGALGTVAAVRGGVYTGELDGEMLHGPAKAAAIVRLAATEGLDLRRCTAYSDSHNDLPMLSAVGRAVAVNPDRRLRRQARLLGWEQRDFRTGRRAALVAAPALLGVGAAAGAALGIAAARHRR